MGVAYSGENFLLLKFRRPGRNGWLYIAYSISLWAGKDADEKTKATPTGQKTSVFVIISLPTNTSTLWLARAPHPVAFFCASLVQYQRAPASKLNAYTIFPRLKSLLRFVLPFFPSHPPLFFFLFLSLPSCYFTGKLTSLDDVCNGGRGKEVGRYR